MATYNLGQAAIVMKGVYAAGTAYLPLNCVTNDGGSWICKKACTGIEPGVTSGWGTYWQSAAVGIKSITVTSASAGTATVQITFSDNTTESFTYNTSAVADGSITPAKLDRPYLSLGLRTLIPSGADLNDYVDLGSFACASSSDATTLLNAPVSIAFILDVYNSTGGEASGKPTSASYRYFLQELTSLIGEKWQRRIYYNGSTTPTVEAWKHILTTNDMYSPLQDGVSTRNLTVADIGKTIKGSWNVAMALTLTQANSTQMPNGAEFAVIRYGTSSGADVTITSDGIRFVLNGDDQVYSSGTIVKVSEAFGTIVLKKVAPSSTTGDLWLVTGNVEVVS